MAYGPFALLCIGAIAYCMPRFPARSLAAAAIIVSVVVLAYVAVPFKFIRAVPGLANFGLSAEDTLKGLQIYSALDNDFAYDDKDLLTGNDFLVGWMADAPDLKGKRVNYWKDVITKDFAQLAQKAAGAPGLNPIDYYRPVIAMSYMLDTFFWMEAPDWKTFQQKSTRAELKWRLQEAFGFHLTNVLVHTLNCLLVFLLVRSLTRRYWVALAAGVLFAAHPIHSESVTWIAGRTDVMATTFYLLAFWLYVRFRNSGSGLVLFAAAVAAARRPHQGDGGAAGYGARRVRDHPLRGAAPGSRRPPPAGETLWMKSHEPVVRLVVTGALAVALFTVLG